MKNQFTKDEVVALKELAQEHIKMNEIFHNKKTNPKPNKFPKNYKGPRSFAEAMSMSWDPNKKEKPISVIIDRALKKKVKNRTNEEHFLIIKEMYKGSVRNYLLSMGNFEDVKI